MTVPPSEAQQAPEGASGFWFELHDPDGRLIYRRVCHNPIRYAYEVRSDDGDPPLVWKSVEKPRGRFTLLVPDLEDGETLILFSSPLDPARDHEPAEEVARFEIATIAGGRRSD